MKTINMLIASTFFVLFSSILIQAAPVIVQSESPNVTTSDLNYLQNALENPPQNMVIKVVILNMKSKSEIYSKNSDGDIVIEEHPAYIRFMLVVYEKDLKKEVKFFELHASSKKDLVYRSVRSINLFIKSKFE